MSEGGDPVVVGRYYNVVPAIYLADVEEDTCCPSYLAGVDAPWHGAGDVTIAPYMKDAAPPDGPLPYTRGSRCIGMGVPGGHEAY